MSKTKFTHFSELKLYHLAHKRFVASAAELKSARCSYTRLNCFFMCTPRRKLLHHEMRECRRKNYRGGSTQHVETQSMPIRTQFAKSYVPIQCKKLKKLVAALFSSVAKRVERVEVENGTICGPFPKFTKNELRNPSSLYDQNNHQIEQ